MESKTGIFQYVDMVSNKNYLINIFVFIRNVILNQYKIEKITSHTRRAKVVVHSSNIY